MGSKVNKTPKQAPKEKMEVEVKKQTTQIEIQTGSKQSAEETTPTFCEQVRCYVSFYCVNMRCREMNPQVAIQPQQFEFGMQRVVCFACGTEAPNGEWICVEPSCAMLNRLYDVHVTLERGHTCQYCGLNTRTVGFNIPINLVYSEISPPLETSSFAAYSSAWTNTSSRAVEKKAESSPSVRDEILTRARQKRMREHEEKQTTAWKEASTLGLRSSANYRRLVATQELIRELMGSCDLSRIVYCIKQGAILRHKDESGGSLLSYLSPNGDSQRSPFFIERSILGEKTIQLVRDTPELDTLWFDAARMKRAQNAAILLVACGLPPLVRLDTGGVFSPWPFLIHVFRHSYTPFVVFYLWCTERLAKNEKKPSYWFDQHVFGCILEFLLPTRFSDKRERIACCKWQNKLGRAFQLARRMNLHRMSNLA